MSLPNSEREDSYSLPISWQERNFIRRALLQYMLDFSSRENGMLTPNKLAEAIRATVKREVSVPLINGFLHEDRNTNTVAVGAIKIFLSKVYKDIDFDKFQPHSSPTKTIALTIQACFRQEDDIHDAKFKKGHSFSLISAEDTPLNPQIILTYLGQDLLECSIGFSVPKGRLEPRATYHRITGHIQSRAAWMFGFLSDMETGSIFFVNIETRDSGYTVFLSQVSGSHRFRTIEFQCFPVSEGSDVSSA